MTNPVIDHRIDCSPSYCCCCNSGDSDGEGSFAPVAAPRADDESDPLRLPLSGASESLRDCDAAAATTERDSGDDDDDSLLPPLEGTHDDDADDAEAILSLSLDYVVGTGVSRSC